MASIFLAAAGNALLPGIGGAVLGTLGKFAGGLIDQQLGLTGTRKFVGPRLESLKLQDSRYGAGIAMLFGRIRVAGQVIWSSDLRETAHEEQAGGGKGGGGGVSTVRYTYSVNVAVALGHGTLQRLAGAWADGKPIYDGLRWKSGLAARVTFYSGDEAQLPDPTLEAALGAGQVPAYRGIAYIVFEQMQLADFGNRLPNLTFEVIANAAAAEPSIGANVEPLVENVNHGFATLGGTPPLIIGGTARQASRILVAGMANAQTANSAAAFVAVSYAVTGALPVEEARATSAPFALNAALASLSWAAAPDGRFVVLCATSSATPTAQASLALYDLQTGSFGAVTQLSVKNFTRSLAWLDALHFVLADHDGSALGVRLFARRGAAVLELGFYPMWGVGSASTRFTIGTAHFIRLSGAVLMITGNAAGSPSALYACALSWVDNQLQVGTPYLLTSGVPAGSLNRADIIPMGDGEYVFAFRRVDRLVLCSFVPGLDSAVITRPWQSIMLSVISNDTAPCRLGNHLLVLQKPVDEAEYRVSEIALQAGDFALAVDAVAVTGGNAVGGSYYLPVALDDHRMVVQGGEAFNLNFAELRLLQRMAGGDTLAAIAGNILQRAGYDNGDYDVAAISDLSITGYSIQPPVTGRAALEPLRLFGAFDLRESDDRLQAVLHSDTAALTIADAELRATSNSREATAALIVQRGAESGLPQLLTVDYLDPALDFVVGSQQARRQAGQAQARSKLSLPLACPADAAKQVAEARLFRAWAERDSVKFSLSRRYLTVEVGDVVQLAGRTLRLQKITARGGLMQCEAVPQFTAPSAAQADSATGQRALPAATQTAVLLGDIPLLRAADDQPGFYLALSGLAGWPGGSVWRGDDGVNYRLLASGGTPAVMGQAVTVLPAAAAAYADNVSSVEVQVMQGELASCSETEWLNGANAALLGTEIIQFKIATLLGLGHYRLSQLLRARRGTEAGVATHVSGERFLLLTAAAVQFVPMPLSDRDRSLQIKALSLGQNLSEVSAVAWSNGMRLLQPLAPAHLRGVRPDGAGGDVQLSWVRRARRDGEWLDLTDVPLDESSERYDLEILGAGGGVVRTVNDLTQPNYLYSAAAQAADFGAVPTSFTARVYQMSARYGRGAPAVATI